MLRKPDSLSPSDTIIQDPVMEPFFITKSQAGGYVVYERVSKGEKNTEYIKTICYPSTFNYALKKVAQEKLNAGDRTKYVSIKDYVKRNLLISEALVDVTGSIFLLAGERCSTVNKTLPPWALFNIFIRESYGP